MDLFSVKKNDVLLQMNANGSDFWLFVADNEGNLSGIDLDMRDLIRIRAELNALIAEVEYDSQD